MKILLNEKPVTLRARRVAVSDLVERFHPGADVLVLNGFPAKPTDAVSAGDQVVLFRRGVVPADEELDALLAARHTPGVARTLRRAAVGIAGLGGLGSTVAVALARIGVGRLVLVDFDVVEPTNINRQQYFLDQIGMRKTEALAATLRRIRPAIDLDLHDVVVTAGNALSLFGSCDVVVEAFDRAELKVMLIEELQSTRPDLPIVAGSGMAGYGPADEIRSVRHGNLWICGDGHSEARPGMGLMAPRVGVAACHQANQAVRILLGEVEAA